MGTVDDVEFEYGEGPDSTKTNQHMDVSHQQQEEMHQGVYHTTTPNTITNGLQTRTCVTVAGGTYPTGTPAKIDQQDSGTHTTRKGVPEEMHRHT